MEEVNDNTEVRPPPGIIMNDGEKEKALKNKKKGREFYIRYYSGHRGQFGHEYMEFEIRRNGKLSYTNCSYYKKDGKIEKEVFVNEIVVEELRKIVEDSGILKQSDEKWPEPNEIGKEEVEIVMNNQHISLCSAKIGSILDVSRSKDVEGLGSFYYFVQDLKSFVFSLMRLHFNVNPI